MANSEVSVCCTWTRLSIQEPALHLCVSLYRYKLLCCTWTYSICLEEHVQYLYTSICTAPCQVCLQEPVLHLLVSVYKSLCCTCTCLPTRACAAPARVYLQEFVLHLHVSVYKSLCCTCTCLSTRACAAPTRFCLHEVMLHLEMYGQKKNCLSNFSVANLKNNFWFHETNRKTTETYWVSVIFGLNWNLFFPFRGHPATLNSEHSWF